MRASAPAASRTAATRCSSRSGASPTFTLNTVIPRSRAARVSAASFSGVSQPHEMTSVSPSLARPPSKVAERPPHRLALQVPERHLQAGSRRLVTHGEQLAVPAAHDRLDVEGIPADDRRPQVLTDHVSYRPQGVAGEFVGRARLADAHDAFVRLHPDQIARTGGERRRGDDERLPVLQLKRVDVHGGDLHDGSLPAAARVYRTRPAAETPARGRAGIGLPPTGECRILRSPDTSGTCVGH